ncbi:MAG: RiPP maturation radical SAM C-methyltransferase [Nitrospira sp.]|nr:RiPP maturation radical SAM C-methyltransferase [Nitrospira sp.]
MTLVLVQAPWATTTRPNLALGILEAIATRKGFHVEPIYANLSLAATIGVKVAETFADTRALFGLSEHLFAVDIFGSKALGSDEFLRASEDAGIVPPILGNGRLTQLRDVELPDFLTSVVARIAALRPRIVGFSATFNQVMASLAIANRLKQHDREILTLFGGACFEADMGVAYHRALPDVINHVFTGEAEEPFEEMLDRLINSSSCAGLPGVTYTAEGVIRHTPGRPLMDMNRSPSPQFDGYFSERERFQQERGVELDLDALPFESSRGCWWGQQAHCVFCGLNPDVLQFRSKSAERVVEEILSLRARYGVRRLLATDWIISREHRREVVARLAALDLDTEIFYETRPDLTRDELAAMAQAGIKRIQPGIEAISTPLLSHMKKFGSALRNIQFLRWCAELGIAPTYNFLAGFPGEKEEWYLDSARIVPAIVHLPPPTQNVFLVELHRFSPLFRQRDEYAITGVRARVDYRFLFPRKIVAPEDFAYFFEFDGVDRADVARYTHEFRKAVAGWLDASRSALPARCELRERDGRIMVEDTRGGRNERSEWIGVHRELLLACNSIRSRGEVIRKVREGFEESMTQRALADLLFQQLVMAEDRRILALPTWVGSA